MNLMNKSTYLFYDIETTGLNKCFDQVLQFAAIRTDLQLNEVDRTEIHIRLNPDVIPAPEAVITHRIGVDQFQNGISEYDAMQKIHALLNTPNTISVGYNSLGFDDEFLRFSFYRNLLPPYTHQYANRCSRMDMYPIALLYFLFKKDHLKWPEGNLKLENINACNAFASGQSHNAMVDVEITLALAKKCAEDETMWRYVTQYFQKQTDESRINDCESKLIIANQPYTLGYFVNGKIGTKSHYIAPVMYLGPHLHYKNQQLWLRLDDPNLSKTKANAITETTRVFRKKLAEPPLFLPIKSHYSALLSDERKKTVDENRAWLTEQPELFRAIRDFHQHDKYPEVPTRDIDAALYSIDFPTAVEEKLFHAFHIAKPAEKMAVAEKFPNPMRKAQAMRIMNRHFREVITDECRADFQKYSTAVNIVDFRGEKKLTVTKALQDIAELQGSAKLDEEQKQLLHGLARYFGLTT